ncbi:MAG: GxxExxY protein [Candidatus Bipolaricaulota bacterium]|nr:GxxExxY protein [Candidatus Bipolaricaulota bacterium]
MAYADLTSEIIAAAIEVHRKLGPGFIKSVYENALVVELCKDDSRSEESHILGPEQPSWVHGFLREKQYAMLKSKRYPQGGKV